MTSRTNRYRITEAFTVDDLHMPDKKKYYVNKRFDHNAYDRAMYELQEKLLSLSDHYPDPEGRTAAFARKIIERSRDSRQGRNHLFSPVSLYILLTCLSELAEGDTRKQIMNLLEFDSIEEMRVYMQEMRKLLSGFAMMRDCK